MGSVETRRERAAKLFSNDFPLVLAAAGEPISKPGGQDQTYPFIAHPEYYWLSGARRPGGVLAYEAPDGWTHFVRPVTDVERLWEGDPVAPVGRPIAELDAWLATRRNKPVALLGAALPGVVADSEHSAACRERLDVARRPKDDAELDLIARAVRATAAGHRRAREVIRPGITERQVQLELEAEMFRHGADATGYGTIVGAGTNAAVLHFEPGMRLIGMDDLVLVDAGGAVEGYTADVTRTYPAGPRLSADRQAIYDIVLAAELAGIARCRPGTEWHEVHRCAAETLARGLRDLGILVGEVEGLLDSGAITLFFPHGIGHMLGLGVRDVGGRAPGRPEGVYCGARLRVDLPLQENFVMTVEPGLYFVPALLDDPARRERYGDAVRWDAVDRWRPVGGVRIEDNIRITQGEPDILTSAIPK